MDYFFWVNGLNCIHMKYKLCNYCLVYIQPFKPTRLLLIYGAVSVVFVSVKCHLVEKRSQHTFSVMLFSMYSSAHVCGCTGQSFCICCCVRMVRCVSTNTDTFTHLVTGVNKPLTHWLVDQSIMCNVVHW